MTTTTTASPAAPGGAGIIDVTPDVVAKWIEAGEAVLVDVREDFEHAAERIEGAEHVPGGALDAAALRARVGDRKLVLHCRSGTRGLEAARRCAAGGAAVYHLAGGIEAWKRAGRPTHRSASAPRLDVMRQVQITAGSLVLIGVLLGAFLSPWFLILAGFVGGGLTFAGLSGWCGMAKLLGRMPWNRGAATCGSASCSM